MEIALSAKPLSLAQVQKKLSRHVEMFFEVFGKKNFDRDLVFASAAFQLPNNGGFAEKRRNTQNFKQLKNSVPKMCPN